MTCDNQCEECGKYTTVKYNGGKYTEYNCLLASELLPLALRAEEGASIK